MPQPSERIDRPDTRATFAVGDPLRALAALAVFGVHTVGSAVHESGYDAALDPVKHFASLYGFLGYVFDSFNSGVTVFFVLSGYLLSRPFLRAYIDDEPVPSVPRYLRNRALRILPAFWAVLLLAFAIYGTRDDSFWESVGLAGFVTSFKGSGMHVLFGQPWSLAVEVRFYLLLPLAGLLLIGLKRVLGRALPRPARIVLVLALLVVGFEASATYALTDSPFYESFGANAKFFAPGIILAVLEFVVPKPLRRHAWLRYGAPIVFVAGLAGVLTSQYFFVNTADPEVAQKLGRYLTPVASGLVVAGPLLWQWSGGRPWRVLDNRVLRWIGVRSYSLFLVHSLILFGLAPYLAVGGYNRSLVTLAVVGLGCSLLASAVLYRWVEVPALRLKSPSGGLRARTRPGVTPAAEGRRAGS